MDNNRYELHNEENNININNINRNDIAFEESNQTEGNLFLPIQVENYLNVNNYFLIFIQSNTDWGNTNEFLLKTIKSLTDTVHYQGMALKQMDKALREKFSFNEINPILNTKLDSSELNQILENVNIELEKRPTNEEIAQILNEKVDKKELAYYLESKPSTNDLYNNRKKIEENRKDIELIKDNIHNIISGHSHQKNEIDKINKELNKKCNLDDVAEALELKLDKENYLNEINKVKNDIEKNIEKKLDEILKKIEAINNNKSDINDFKLISDAFQDMKLSLTQRVDDIDNDLDRLIENIKSQFQTTNKLINDLENKKGDKKDFDEVNILLNKKLDEEKFNNLISDIKNNLFESLNNFKEDYLTNIKIFENKLENKNETIITELNKQNDAIKNFTTNEKEEINLTINEILQENNLEINNNLEQINSEIKNLEKNLDEKINKKLDENKFDTYLTNIKKELNSKISILDSQKNIQDIMISFEQKINILITELKQELITNFENLLHEKADITLLNDKISSIDFNILKDYITTIDYDLKQKMESMFNDYINITNTNMENLNKEMVSNITNNKSQINSLLNSKANIDELNIALNQIKKELNNKVNNIEFKNSMNNQAMINDIICNENQVGRWLWKSNKNKNKLAIPWDVQSVNTAPDNYIWEKSGINIIVINGGIYQVSLGLYFNSNINKKIQVQIIVNSDNVINVKNNNFNNLNNNNDYYSNKGNNLKKMNSVSYNDFVLLKDNSKIIVTFNGEEGFGFIGLKKL